MATKAETNGAAKKVAEKKVEEDTKPQADKYWSDFYLMKNEPDDFSVDDLAETEGQTCHWGTQQPQSAQLRAGLYFPTSEATTFGGLPAWASDAK